MPLYALRTCHNTLVCMDPDGAGFAHAPHGHGFRPALLFMAGAGVGFVIGERPGAGDGTGIQTWPMRVQTLAGNQTCRLISADGTRLVAALPLAEGARAGPLVADRLTTGPWETFGLVPAAASAGLVNSAVLRTLRQLAAARPTLPALVAMLCATPPEAPVPLLLDYLSVMPDQLGLLPRLLLDHAEAVGRACSFDPWFAIGLPALARWHATRDDGPRRRSIGPELDLLADLHDKPVSVGRAIVAGLRRHVVPRRRACILATARSEGIYLLEWIAYHQAIGVEHFFIYSNDNDDGSDQLLAALADAGVITLIENRLESAVAPQLKAYAHALGLMPEILDYEWALIIDVDEFVVFDTARFMTFADVIEWHEARATDAIALNWLMFGTFGVRHHQKGALLTRRFTTRFAEVNQHIKTLARPREFMHSHPHWPTSISGKALHYRDSAGEPYVSKPTERAHAAHPVADTVWVNHYWSKSIDEVVCKFSRNPGDQANVASRPAARIAQDLAFRVLDEEDGVETVTDGRIAACAPDLQDRIDALLVLPGVRDAAGATLLAFEAKVAAIRAAFAAIDRTTVSPEAAAAIGLIVSDPA